MNLDDLKETWRQSHGELGDSRVGELASQALERASQFEKTILRRDLIETAAAIFVIFGFGLFLREGFPWISRLGMIIIVLGAGEVIVTLHLTRRRDRRPQHDLPLTEFCAAEIARVDRQIRLLRYVNWWYSGPMLLGVCVFLSGILFSVPLPLHISVPAFAAFCVLILIFGWIIYRINQRALRNELAPLREELAGIYESLIEEPSSTVDS